MTHTQWTDGAQEKRDRLDPADQKQIKELEKALGKNVHAGTLYQSTTPVRWAFTGLRWTLIYEKSHPKDPRWVDIVDFQRNT